MDYSISPHCQVCERAGRIAVGPSRVSWANICGFHYVRWRQLFDGQPREDWKRERDRVRYYTQRHQGQLPDDLGASIECQVCGQSYLTSYSVRFKICRHCFRDGADTRCCVRVLTLADT